MMKKGEIWLMKNGVSNQKEPTAQRMGVILVDEPYLKPLNFWFYVIVHDWSPIFDKYSFPDKIKVEPTKAIGFTHPIALCPFRAASSLESFFERKIGELDPQSLKKIIDLTDEARKTYLDL